MEEVVVPLTERSNTLTEDIDKASPTEIVSLLKKCDEQIFIGWGDYEGVKDKKIIAQLKEIAVEAAELVSPRGDRSAIILSGCGTSGRIAFLISREFNELASRENQRQCYRYICAGNDHVLTRSVESFEDDWNAGKETLLRESGAFEKILFIGITCGLSAAFVGGQLEYCLQHPDKFAPYLLGFNPANQARTSPNKGTSKVLLDIAREMEEKGCLLNPIIGPEAIAGSTRMKGGTTTKMILESIFIAAHQLAYGQSSALVCEQVINVYEFALGYTYRKQRDIAKLIELAGTSIVKGGTMTYLGWGSLGIMAMIDAAECVPTFGASHEDVRCFISGGYQVLRNKQGDLSSQGDASKIGFDYFRENRCHTLSEKDTIIFILRSLSLHEKEVFREVNEMVKRQRCKVAFVGITTDEDEHQEFQEFLKGFGNPKSVNICLSSSKLKEHCQGSHDEHQKFLEQCVAEICLKWVLNAVSTGAYIKKGKVWKNCMIDLKLTNRKLFERAMSIVSLVANVNHTQAKHYLLKSIYRTDTLSPAVLEANISKHVQQASLVDRVVPLALLISKGSCTLASGLKALNDCPIIRQYIGEHI